MSAAVDIGQYDGGFERDEARYKERTAATNASQEDGLRQLDTDVERWVSGCVPSDLSAQVRPRLGHWQTSP